MSQRFKKVFSDFRVYLFFGVFVVAYLTLKSQKEEQKVQTKYRYALKSPYNKAYDEIKLIQDTTITLNKHADKFKNDYPKVLILFDGGCSTCFATLSGWRKIIENKNLDIEKFIFVGYNASAIDLKYLGSSLLTPRYNLFKDFSFVFGKENGLAPGPPRTLLVDSLWQVFIEGNPFENDKLKDTYINSLKK